MGTDLVSRTSILDTLPTFTLPIGRKGTRFPRPEPVYPFKLLVFAAPSSDASDTGADEIWTVGVTAGDDEKVPRIAICQSLTTYLAALPLCVTTGAQMPLIPNRWRTSRAELPFSLR